jgi:regulator of sigma D
MLGFGLKSKYLDFSPNLNLIERVWRFGKKEIAMKYYDNFNEFVDKIDSIIDSSSKENLAAMNKLLGEKVQLFDDLVLIAGNAYESANQKKPTAA